MHAQGSREKESVRTSEFDVASGSDHPTVHVGNQMSDIESDASSDDGVDLLGQELFPAAAAAVLALAPAALPANGPRHVHPLSRR